MKRIAYILAAVLTLAACAKETIHHPSEAEAPQTASVYEPVITVDQETNQVTFSLDAKGVIPVWLFYDNKTEDYSVRYAINGLQRIFTAAGDYKVRMQVMNASGVTPDYVERTFHVDNTLVDFDKYIKLLVGSGDRVWRINNKVAAHQACGESIENPTGWWAASADEKDGTGLYDNRITFSAEGEYTFDPGEAGTVYVNAGVTAAPYAEDGHSEDYQVAVAQTTAEYSFSVEGENVYLCLPAGTPFPYIPNNDFVSDPRFIVQKISAKELVLVWYTATGNGGGPIAWQFILTSEAGEVKFKGFNYNADSNLWKGADAAHTVGFWYAPGWAQIADPDMTQNGAEYTLTLPEATTDQWQAQFTITPTEPLVLTADKSYDFSIIVNTDTELPGMTLKLTDVGDDNNYLFVEREKFPAGETVYYLTDLAGIDAPNGVKMVFDFGGNDANTEVSLANIVVKDHAIDDGTVLPEEGGDDTPQGDVAPFDYDADTNLWKPADAAHTYSQYYAPDWSQLDSPEVTNNGNVYSFSCPSATTAQWQNQFFIIPTDAIALSADKHYDFQCKVEVSEKVNGVTFKLTDTSSDDNFLFTERRNLKGYELFTFTLADLAGIDAAAVKMVFDFGGNDANTDVTISEIILREHE
jgi:plastocyanin